jgi:hypothetical protein
VDRVTQVSYTPDDMVASTRETDSSGWDRVTTDTYDPMGHVTSETVYGDQSGHPSGWWPLNQTSGTTVTDASGTGNTASATGVTWSNPGATFAGTTGQQIATNGPVLDTTGSYSVSAWVNLSQVSGWQTVVGQDGSQDSAFNLQLDSSTLKWNFAHNNTDTTNPTITRAEGGSQAVAGTWYHLVGTYNSSTGAMDMYVNGALAGTATSAAPWASSGPLTIGRGKHNGSSVDLVHGQVQNVQVYPRVLSASEVSALYNAGRNGGTAGSWDQQTTAWTYDQRGLPTSMTDPDGNTTN